MNDPRLKKALGQHHLRESRLCDPLVRFLAPQGQLVLEIGPGGGVLTTALRDAGAEVLAWELDLGWGFELARRFAGDPDLGLVLGDALEIPWGRLPPGVMVAGNLPYNVATVLVDRLLDHPDRVARAAFLVQKEVAERLVAGPGGRDYGALSVLTAARAEARMLGRVRPGSFRPPPKVESAFVGLVPRSSGGDKGLDERYRRLVFEAFGQRRKTLVNALSASWPRERVREALAGLGFDLRVRAEVLSHLDFVELLHRLGTV